MAKGKAQKMKIDQFSPPIPSHLAENRCGNLCKCSCIRAYIYVQMFAIFGRSMSSPSGLEIHERRFDARNKWRIKCATRQWTMPDSNEFRLGVCLSPPPRLAVGWVEGFSVDKIMILLIVSGVQNHKGLNGMILQHQTN